MKVQERLTHEINIMPCKLLEVHVSFTEPHVQLVWF